MFESIFTEEGYDGGGSPEPLVNVTAVPLVSEILQVWHLFLCYKVHVFLSTADIEEQG